MVNRRLGVLRILATCVSCFGCLLSAGAPSAGAPDWIVIGPAVFNDRLNSTNPPLALDIRGRETYLAGTIRGALHAGTNPQGFLPASGNGLVVLIAAEGAEDEYIESWIRRIRDAGHTVAVLEGGFSGWRDRGYPVVQPDVSFKKPGTVPFLIPRGICEGGEPAQVFD